MPPKKKTHKHVCHYCNRPETKKNPLVSVAGELMCRDCLSDHESMLKDAINTVSLAKDSFDKPALTSGGKKEKKQIDDLHDYDPALAADVDERETALIESLFRDFERDFDEDFDDDFDDLDDDDEPPVPSPREIKSFLDQYVIGQDDAKRMLSVAVHNHYKRISAEKFLSMSKLKEYADVDIEKSNILLVGPTGSGKTLLARTLAKMLDVPFAIADATTLTEAGYVGEDVENILLNLIQAADMDVERASKGIVFVDEIDKISRRTDNVSITRDVSGEGVQQALLKIIEGTVARVPPAGGRKHPEQRYIEIDTTNILFICGGAFVGLDKIMRRRSDKKHFGFSNDDSAASGNDGVKLRPEPEDLIKFGLIPEFVGRLPIVTMLNELTEEDLVHILTQPKNCLVRQYAKLFAIEGVDIIFEDDAVKEIARIAMERKTGARGLRSITEELMMDIMYESDKFSKLKNMKLVITQDMVQKHFSGNHKAITEMLKIG